MLSRTVNHVMIEGEGYRVTTDNECVLTFEHRLHDRYGTHVVALRGTDLESLRKELSPSSFHLIVDMLKKCIDNSVALYVESLGNFIKKLDSFSTDNKEIVDRIESWYQSEGHFDALRTLHRILIDMADLYVNTYHIEEEDY